MLSRVVGRARRELKRCSDCASIGCSRFVRRVNARLSERQKKRLVDRGCEWNGVGRRDNLRFARAKGATAKLLRFA